ncbi:MAG: DUF2796 domain-containing protein [Planktomarina sp.]
MKIAPLFALTWLIVTPALAEDTHQLDAHEHGVGELNIAFDGSRIAMEFHAPGADIVGFEYEATNNEDLAAIDSAIAKLEQPLTLFGLPDAAGCTVTSAVAALEGDEDHDHGDDHEEHDDHAENDGHTEFHAEYLLTCANIATVNTITFAYFGSFPNALEVEVQVLSDAGATSFEVERDAPILNLGNL